MTQAAEVGPEPEEEPALGPEPEDEPALGPEPEDEPALGRPGPAFDRKAPYVAGLLAGLGLLTAVAAGKVLLTISGVLVEIVVSLFIAAGLDPLVRVLE
ncbi:MAG TPA: hypothetical protein VHA72_09150, partial [Nocardioides sp.]|nr:hypothetical protein [Nocardioides sp.]